jgi:hypothetical protein
MATIDLNQDGSIPADTLQQSTQGRSGTPDGNIYFDVATGELQVITVEELAQVNFGAGLVANPISNADGITMRALYGFERQERAIDEALRQYDNYFDGSYKFSGAYEMVNGRKLAASDREKIRSSGWIERAINKAIDRIYFGSRSLGNIESASQPYYQLVDAGVPVDFAKAGAVNEAIQVFGVTTNGDAGAGDFDSRAFLAQSLRTFGYNYSRKSLSDSGVVVMDGFSTGFGLGETPHVTSANYTLADVYGGAAISPFTGMSLEKLAAAQVESGFNEADGSFSWVLHNTANGNLEQCVAYLDALAQTDDDIDSGALTITNGKRVGEWYSYNAESKVVTDSGADALGLFIENLPASNQQSVIFTDDSGSTKTYPFSVEVSISVGDNAKADANAWYQAYYADGAGDLDFNTVGAVTVKDSNNDDVKGLVGGNDISFGYAYDGNTQAGLPAGVDKQMIVAVEGNGTATAA